MDNIQKVINYYMTNNNLEYNAFDNDKNVFMESYIEIQLINQYNISDTPNFIFG